MVSQLIDATISSLTELIDRVDHELDIALAKGLSFPVANLSELVQAMGALQMIRANLEQPLVSIKELRAVYGAAAPAMAAPADAVADVPVAKRGASKPPAGEATASISAAEAKAQVGTYLTTVLPEPGLYAGIDYAAMATALPGVEAKALSNLVAGLLREGVLLRRKREADEKSYGSSYVYALAVPTPAAVVAQVLSDPGPAAVAEQAEPVEVAPDLPYPVSPEVVAMVQAEESVNADETEDTTLPF